MRVLIAGATGAIGAAAARQLAAGGHEVVGLARSDRRTAALAGAGIRVEQADLLDAATVHDAVRRVAPEAVVHLATAIPAELNPKHIDRDFAQTNLLRTQGARNLFDAASAAGASRIVAEGVAFAYDPDGKGAAHEDVPLWPTPPKTFAPVLEAMRELESRTRDAGGLVLRFGHLYGPNTAFGADGSFVKQVKAGKVPLVGGGTSVFSFTHAEDAAAAVVAAVEGKALGALNIVDDDPARMAVWLPYLAELLGARKPRSAPAALAKFAVGDWGVAYMTRLRGADNSHAKSALAWAPRYSSWRDGFKEITSGN
ncbi:NAD-dependent epimerase/dehydratase family protein [Actinospica durhamensis]|uniref:NAD-dependent epimerase/dehydratase family protein n=1 Tax=Actinospica durhamensis TaxID=1508375 RepID=A0A941IUK1_9ACTN|nr:NAD-dependent epimerase/dehydratase family protein [Actinospica durhamensis]MBR7837613.1 NAD-dependent epimerase/dehydratase family protein [Actinospica durhamensis]